MVEYGHAVGQGTGHTGGGSGVAQSGDWSAQIGGIVSDTANNIAALPPAELLLLVIAVIVGFVILKRAF